MAFGSTGCSEADGEAAIGSVEQHVIPNKPYAEVGVGFVPSGNGFEGDERGLCLPNRDIVVEPQFSGTISGTIVSSASQVEESLKLSFNGTYKNADTTIADVGAKLAALEKGKQNFAAAVVIGRIRTVGHRADAYYDYKSGPEKKSRCDQNDPTFPTDMDSFVDQCGTHYVKRDQMGGLVVFVAELTSFSQEKREEIGLALGGNIPTGETTSLDLSFGATVNRLNNTSGQSLTWDSYVYGFNQLPGMNDPDGDGWFGSTISDWTNYYNTIGQAAGADANANIPYSSSYGMVLNYEVEPYSDVQLGWCKYPVEHFGLQCVQDYETSAAEVMSSTSELRAIYDSVAWKLDNASRVTWGPLQNEVTNVYGKFRHEFEECEAELAVGLTQCFAAMDSPGTPQDVGNAVCAACDVSTFCDLQQLEDMANSLPETSIFANGRSYDPFMVTVGNNESKELLETENWLCVFAGMGGKFVGGSERVRLTTVDQAGVTLWKAVTTSGRTAAEERVHSQYNCVPRDLFEGENNNDFLPEQFETKTLSSSGDVTGMLPYTSTFAWGVAGIGGNMRGLGEGAWTTLGPLNTGYRVKSEQNGIVADFMGLGLDSTTYGDVIYSGSPQPVEFAAEVNSTTGDYYYQDLVGLENNFCFITHVAGQFDGAYEYVRLRHTYSNWQLVVRADPSKNVRVKARCIPYVQRAD
ncbi:hypothetical protein DV096_16805 [Bradymonadaceae bacterium TMQ3]|nr:hypothetical protein DV096_16805 [Bradymonadaceae bacterium TMQ3]TXC69371.1 hypothetical protein FRC91_17385 [Bradymonadales bacterium TMQ1]